MRTIFKTVVALGAVLVWSAAAQAALTISGPASYTPGDVINITLTGDSEGQLNGQMRVLLDHDPALTAVGAAQGALNTSSGINYWVHTGTSGNIGGCGAGGIAANQCVGVDAFDNYTFGSGMIDLLFSTLSTWQFDTTGASGNLTFTTVQDGAGFFGLGEATPFVVTEIVPEPASAALLGLGLMTLGMVGRRR